MKACERREIGLKFQYPRTWVLEEERGWIDLFERPPGKGHVSIRMPRSVEGARADAARECAIRIGKGREVVGDASCARATCTDIGGIHKLLWVVAKEKRVVEAWVIAPDEKVLQVGEGRSIVESIRLF